MINVQNDLLSEKINDGYIEIAKMYAKLFSSDQREIIKKRIVSDTGVFKDILSIAYHILVSRKKLTSFEEINSELKADIEFEANQWAPLANQNQFTKIKKSIWVIENLID